MFVKASDVKAELERHRSRWTSQKILSERSGVSVRAIYRILNDQSKVTWFSVAERLLEAIDVPMWQLEEVGWSDFHQISPQFREHTWTKEKNPNVNS